MIKNIFFPISVIEENQFRTFFLKTTSLIFIRYTLYAIVPIFIFISEVKIGLVALCMAIVQVYYVTNLTTTIRVERSEIDLVETRPFRKLSRKTIDLNGIVYFEKTQIRGLFAITTSGERINISPHVPDLLFGFRSSDEKVLIHYLDEKTGLECRII